MTIPVKSAQKELLVVQNLKTYFPIRAGILQRVVANVKAVDDVSFTIREGETFGLVGESGCGKTTVSRAIMERVGEDKVVYLPHDSYYLDLDQMPISAGEVVNFDHPDSLETTLMVEHIQQLAGGRTVLCDASTA